MFDRYDIHDLQALEAAAQACSRERWYGASQAIVHQQ